jgi:hypothetical protein
MDMGSRVGEGKVSLAGGSSVLVVGDALLSIAPGRHGFDVDSIDVCWNFLLRSSL